MSKGNKLRRKIYFFRMFFEDGPRDPKTGAAYDSSAVFTHLNKFSLMQYDDDAYMEHSSDTSVTALSRSGGKLILGNARHRAHPQLELQGQVSPLRLKPDVNIFEPTHMIYFSEGILGSEFNFYGPRAVTLSKFFAHRFSGSPPLHIEPICNRSAMSVLKDVDIGTVSLFSISIHRSYADILKDAAPSLHATIRSASELSNAPMIKVELKRETAGKRKGILSQASDLLHNLADLAGLRNACEDMHIRAKSLTTNKVKAFDLLADKFVEQVEVTRNDDRSRVVDESAMFGAIEKAYNQKRDELLNQPTLGLWTN